MRNKDEDTEIETAAELIRIAFAWSYAEDAALERKLNAMIADLDPEERDRFGWATQ